MDQLCDRTTADGMVAAQGGTFVVFDLFGQTMGVDVRLVREILAAQRISRLPGARPEIAGVIDLRGRCVPIVDLALTLGMPREAAGEDGRIVVFDLGEDGGHCQVGIMVERVRDVARIDAAQIEPASSAGASAWDGNGLLGATRRDGALIFLVDIGRFLGGFRAAAALGTR